MIFTAVLTLIFLSMSLYLIYQARWGVSRAGASADYILIFQPAVLFIASMTAFVYAAFFFGRPAKDMPSVNRVVLLSENNAHKREYLLREKRSALIGKGDADIDLEGADSSPLIAYEHAVMNRVGNDWFVERVSAEGMVGLRHKEGPYIYILKVGICYKLYTYDVLYIENERLLVL